MTNLNRISSVSSDPTAYTPTILGFGTGATVKAFWTREGKYMYVTFSVKPGSVGAAVNCSITMPTGYTVDTSVTSDLQASIYDSCGMVSVVDSTGGAASTYTATILHLGGTPGVFGFFGPGGSAIANQWRNDAPVVTTAFYYRGWFRIPILQWTTGITVADRALEEFAFNTQPALSGNDYTSFGNGPAGTPSTALTAACTRYVQFQNAILPTDQFFFEYQEVTGGPWHALTHLDNSKDLGPYTIQNNISYGIKLSYVAGSSTQMAVTFGTYAWSNLSWGGVGIPWSAGWRWRVRKVSGGASVGFPVSARNVVGDITGTAIPSGNIGEAIGTVRSGTGGNAFTTRTSVVINTGWQAVGSITLNKGNYLFSGMINCASSGSINLDYYVVVGGVAVTLTYHHLLESNGANRTVSIGALPIDITVDGTVVAIYAMIGSGTTSNNYQETWVTRR